MSPETFEELDALRSDPAAMLQRLIDQLTEAQDFHRLFDALLMQKKHELGLPLGRPGVIDDVAEEHRAAIEETYIAAARQVGQMLLDAGRLNEAWVYLRTIREPEAIRRAIETVQVDPDDYEKNEELINVALYEGAHPVKGLELLLQTHGTCNTVTATDQQLPNLNDSERRQVAAMLVNNIYEDLKQSVLADVRRRVPTESDEKSLKQLIAGREFLFEEGNYHIDVSHLNAIVRFSRALDASSPELPLALELAEYGSQLDEPLRYGAEPPFDEFYQAHAHYFRVLLGTGADQSLAWFRKRLATAEDTRDQQMIAYVLVDLLQRVDRLEDAVHFAAEHLCDLDDPQGFSFAALCHEAGTLDKLQDTAREKSDLVTYVGALLAATPNPA